MSQRQSLIAFLAVLGAIVLMFLVSAACLYAGRSVEAIGIGGVMTGLIGLLGTFKPATAKAHTERGDINQGGEA